MKSKIWSMALSLAIAFTLWYYVISVVSPGSEAWYYNIPVVFEGETVLNQDRGLMITSDMDDIDIDLKLSGNRTDLAKVNSGNITIKVDLSKVYDPGIHELTYSIAYPGDVPQGALTTESKSPETIKLTVEKRVSKPVDIQVNFTGSAAENFMADTENRILDYTTVNLVGPSSVVEQIRYAKIDVDLTDRMESISENFRFTLCDADGNPVDAAMVTTDIAEVHLEVKIRRFKQIPLRLNLTYGGGAWEDTVEVNIEPSTIMISGGEALLADLEELVLGSIDLSVTETDLETTYAITLPEGITNLSERTEALVTVKFKDLAIRELEISKFDMVGIPEGLEAELHNQVMKIRLRGPAAVMDQLTADNVEVRVDFTGKEVGSFTLKPVINLKGDAFAKVGPVGSYSVSATLREVVEETTDPEATEGAG